MIEKGVISQGQFIILAVLYIIATSILIGPPLFVLAAKQNAWMGIIIGICFGVLHAWMYGILAKRYPNKTLIEFNESILGKWAGKALSLLFFIFFLILTSGLLRIIGDFITTSILTDTPIEAIEVTFMLLLILAVRLGLETFARTAEMVVPWVLIFFFLLTFCLLPEIEMKNLFPILEDGINPVIKATIYSLGVPFSDLVILLMIAPTVASPKKIGKALGIATFTGGFILLTIVLLAILVLGANSIIQINYPIYILAQKINIGNFIQRIEVLAGAIFFISAFIKSTISFYSTVVSFAHIFQLKKFENLTLPFGIVIISLATVMSPNIVYFNNFLSTTWVPFAVIFGSIIPFFLFTIDSIKGAMRNK
ncbi:GerAB/ArcD/ProY family transporter [Neobacillus drentensis]|uniref:GerAB/ArcD/ProY family transporter n=1 Tax=Neobacillus drentensis TaxID=220684 RepID=UPI003000ABAA